MYKSPLIVMLTLFGLTACVSKPYSNPENLLFQKKGSGSTQTINVKRDSVLCAGDSVDKQNCPINFYIDNFKSGSFFINNAAKFNLRAETYNFKVQNCTTECAICDFDIAINSSTSRDFMLSVDSKGQPYIIHGGKALSCPVGSASAGETTKINLYTDTLFKFNGSTLSELLPKGRQEILELAAKVRDGFISVSQVNLIGHTDRLGSDAYNLKLGQERANTIRDLLIQNGVSSRHISVESKGKQQPITSGCNEIASRHKLQSCLQPDRRVVVEVIGKSK